MDCRFDPFVRYAAQSTHFLRHLVIARDCRLLYVLSGSGSFQCGTDCYSLCPNTLLYYPYGVPYHIRSDKEQVLRFYTINFDFSFDQQEIPVTVPETVACHEPSREIRSIPDALQDIFSGPICIPNAVFAENDLRVIYHEALQKREGYAFVQSAHLKLILIHLLRYVKQTGCEHPLCRQIKELVEQEPRRNNRQLAELLNYHPFYLNDLFKQHEGMTLHQYIVRQRLTRSCELITTTSLSLQEIALQCGFSSQSHFSEAFKRAYAIPPGQLRKQT